MGVWDRWVLVWGGEKEGGEGQGGLIGGSQRKRVSGVPSLGANLKVMECDGVFIPFSKL